MFTKIFIGYRLQFELTSHLEPLIQIRFKGKDYVGMYLPTTQPTLDEIKNTAHVVERELQAKIDIHLKRFPPLVFAELFLG